MQQSKAEREAWLDGYTAGTHDGFEDGFTEGYDQGFLDAKEGSESAAESSQRAWRELVVSDLAEGQKIRHMAWGPGQEAIVTQVNGNVAHIERSGETLVQGFGKNVNRWLVWR